MAVELIPLEMSPKIAIFEDFFMELSRFLQKKKVILPNN